MKNLKDQFDDIRKEFSKEVYDDIEKVGDEASDYTLDLVKKRSPRDEHRKAHRVGKRRYASGWVKKKENSRFNIGRYIIHNPSNYRLTHLLENGHVIKNQYGTYGRTRAFPHVRVSEADGIEYYDKKLKEKLSRS